MSLRNQSAPQFVTWMTEALPRVEDHLWRRYGDEQLAEQAAASAIAMFWEKWRTNPDFFDSPRHALNWSKRTGRHQAVNQLRWRNRHQGLPIRHDEVEGFRVRQETTPEAMALDQLRVWQCLERLPDRYRDVLHGHFYEGRTDVEIGTHLFGEELSARARGLRVWRLRQEAQRMLGELLIDAGVDLECWQGQRPAFAGRLCASNRCSMTA